MKTTPTIQKTAALLAVVQGVVTAVLPRVTIRLVKLVLSRNFENTDELEPRPMYVRQTRAAGIGLAAAGVAAYAMERVVTERSTDTGDVAAERSGDTGDTEN